MNIYIYIFGIRKIIFKMIIQHTYFEINTTEYSEHKNIKVC